MTGPSRVGPHIAAANDSLDGLRDMNPWGQVVHLAYAAVQALCALALAVDHLADAITTEETP